MAEYLPKFKPGQAITYKASAAITAGQVVAVTGDGTVGPAGATSSAWVGVAAFDAAVGDNVTFYSGGVQRPTASGAVSVGAAVATAAGGKVATSATPTSAQFVGVALTAATDDGDVIDVAFAR